MQSVAVLVLALSALGATDPKAVKADPATTRGKKLFFDASLGRNGVACADCHANVEDEASQGDGRIRAGHTLFGAAGRPYWRGDGRRTTFPTLRKAIDACVQIFQGGSPLAAEDSLRLAAYLESISPRKGQAPIAIQPALEAGLDYDRDKYRGGEATRGRDLFFAACHSCHPLGRAGIGPAIFGKQPAEVALKVREGNGLLRGNRSPTAFAPFFGKDRLSDAQVADIAAYVATLTKD
ncbi:MAG: c-type cytochrome [Myxococcota bacterium]